MKLSELVEDLYHLMEDAGDIEVDEQLINLLMDKSENFTELRRAFFFKDKITIKYLQKPGGEE